MARSWCARNPRVLFRRQPRWAATWVRNSWDGARAGFSTRCMPGKVYLVGAGPGDPELITWKGRRILERADTVLFDHLANDALVDLAPASAERVYVGKKKSLHSYTQEEI